MPDFPDIGRKSFSFGADERIPEALLPIRDNGQDEVGEGLEVAPVDLLDEGMGVGAGPGERDVGRAERPGQWSAAAARQKPADLPGQEVLVPRRRGDNEKLLRQVFKIRRPEGSRGQAGESQQESGPFRYPVVHRPLHKVPVSPWGSQRLMPYAERFRQTHPTGNRARGP